MSSRFNDLFRSDDVKNMQKWNDDQSVNTVFPYIFGRFGRMLLYIWNMGK